MATIFPYRGCGLAIAIALALIGCSGGNHVFTPEQLTLTPDIVAAAKSPDEAVVASIRTIRPELKSIARSMKATGVVTYDSRRVYSITARAGGRLENVTLRYAGQRVRKGDRIAEIYSPQLVTTQRELLFLLRDDPGNAALIAGARKKLQLLGLSAHQVESLIASKEVQTTLAIFSPYTGILMPDEGPRAAVDPGTPPAVGGSAMDAMTNGSSARTGSLPTSQPFLREGNYVSAGETLFKIADTRALRIELSLPASMTGAVKVGDELQLMLDDGSKRTAVAELVQPFYEEGETFSRVRVYPPNMDGLHIGQLVTATILVSGRELLSLPREAVLDLGTRQVVFVKEGKLLKPRAIVTGVRTADVIEITGGLATADEVAANAHFLIDSEGFVKPMN